MWMRRADSGDSTFVWEYDVRLVTERVEAVDHSTDLRSVYLIFTILAPL